MGCVATFDGGGDGKAVVGGVDGGGGGEGGDGGEGVGAGAGAVGGDVCERQEADGAAAAERVGPLAGGAVELEGFGVVGLVGGEVVAVGDDVVCDCLGVSLFGLRVIDLMICLQFQIEYRVGWSWRL